MGWFDDQIRQRKKNDADVFTDAFINIAGAVMGNRGFTALNDKRTITKNAIDEILKYYRVKTREVPESIKEMDEQLEYLLRPNGIMRRPVTLSRGWYRDAIGAMLGRKKDDGSVVALIPSGFSGYVYIDNQTKKHIKITRKNETLFEPAATAFYKPLPLKKIGIPELIRYIVGTLSFSDFVMIALSTFAAALMGLFMPRLNNLLFSRVIASGSLQLLFAIAVFMVCVTVSTLMIQGITALITARINTKMSISVQAATMMRILSLPADFFKDFSAGELANRSQYINTLCSLLVSTVLTTGLTSIFSLIYIFQIFAFAPALVAPALIFTLATLAFSIVSALVEMKIAKRQMTLASKESGMSYALITGVQKIKLAGAEKRAFARWGNLYASQAALTYNPPTFIKVNTAITTAISLLGTIVMYYTAVKAQVSIADYYAFNTAYAMVSGAFMSLSGIALTVARLKPIVEMASPMLEAVPEVSEGKQVIECLSGGIEISNLSFRYNATMPNVIDDVSLKIHPGQYVAVVGQTGCGKSTLMRLILGFEQPQKGAVYYDGKNLNTIDLKSLRRKIGVVMQDGKLFQGDIYSNIVISAPRLTLDDAWEAAELSGMAEDIRHMPMGMHTIISEGSGGFRAGRSSG
jgi:ABC-type bacteriocin/lantibiotic exporter with double-glycine peptidase domain